MNASTDTGAPAERLSAFQQARAAPPPRGDERLPAGVEVHALRPYADERGVFTELLREEWGLARPVQWNAVRSEAGVLRGVHLHPRHDDYLTVVAGRASVGLHDLRPASATSGRSTVVELDAERPAAIVIPHGVAHGFLFHSPSIHVYAVSHTWDPDDELGCRWDDPELGISWPETPSSVSDRDLALPSLAGLAATLARAT